MRNRPTYKEIRRVARAAIKALSANGLESCLFGSAACALYGMEHREPGDVDIIVLTEMEQESIKDLMVASDRRFYHAAAADPNVGYRVLWFRLWAPRPWQRRRCKVDILIPGVIHIPPIQPRRIVYVGSFPPAIPVVPLLALLLMKLQGWMAHREDDRQRMRDKISIDEDDIRELLVIAIEDGVKLQKERWMARSFVRRARGNIAEFLEMHPGSAAAWKRIGFNV